MKKINIFSYFRKVPESNEDRFSQVEDKIVAKFAETEDYRSKFSESQRNEEKHKEELRQLELQNPGLKIASKSVENRTLFRRLKRRKWLAVVVDALLAISTIQMLFMMLIHIYLSKGTSGSTGFAAILKPLLFGLLFAYALLALAIDYRYDDNNIQGNNLFKLWNKYSYIIPLLFIPFVNLYLVFTHPGSVSNILWIALAIFSILLNLKAASYSKQYVIMAHTKDIETQAKPAQDGIKKEQSIQNRIINTMGEVKKEIVILATQYRRLYENYGANNRPQIALNLPYRFVLNVRIYFEDVLPVYSPNLTGAAGTLAEYQQFWDMTTRINIIDNNVQNRNNSELPQGNQSPDNNAPDNWQNNTNNKSEQTQRQEPINNDSSQPKDYETIIDETSYNNQNDKML